MKVVVDIPEKYLNSDMIKIDVFTGENNTITDINVESSYAKFQVLPKGHGDLIDRNALEIEIKSQIIYCDDRAIHQSDLAEQLRYMNTSYGLKLSHNIIEFAPTMIDADKENEDDKSNNRDT